MAHRKFPEKIVCKPSAKVAYMPIGKVATNSIKRTFLKNDEAVEWQIRYNANQEWELLGADEYGNNTKSVISAEKINSYFIFTFVRNPFTRFVSCFQDKYNYIEAEKVFCAKHHMQNRSNFPASVIDFADFARQAIKIPDEISDVHFKTQLGLIQLRASLGVQVDFIGKFETLTTEFEPIRQKYKLLPLEVKNSSEDKALHKKWQDYYTPELARLVYERYLSDFKRFGYQAEYPKLLACLNAPLPWRFRKRKLLGKLGVKRYANAIKIEGKIK